MTLADQIANIRKGASGTNPERPAKPRQKRKWISPWQYLKEIKDELTKVSWPKRQEVMRGTVQVLVFSAVLAVILGGLDFGFQFGLDKLLKREVAKNQGDVPAVDTLPSDQSEPIQLPEGVPPPPGLENVIDVTPSTTNTTTPTN